MIILWATVLSWKVDDGDVTTQTQYLTACDALQPIIIKSIYNQPKFRSFPIGIGLLFMEAKSINFSDWQLWIPSLKLKHIQGFEQ
jgi:hypothetical protein